MSIDNTAQKKQGAKTLIIGWDGAEWSVIHRLLEAKALPTIAKLIDVGATSRLCSTTPPMTLPSWSSMLTGCNPGKHGIFDFVHKDADTWKLRFSSAMDRQVPTIHELLSAKGKRVLSVAVPTTWPPSKVNGVIVSGFDSPVSTGIDGSFCYPPSVYTEIQEKFGGLCFADFQESDIGDGWHEQAIETMHREVQRKTDIFSWLLSRERWDCAMIVFGESDTVSHHFWRFHDKNSPRYPREKVADRLYTAVEDIYIALDKALARIIAVADYEHICICSDHGFGPAGDKALFLNRYLQENGWLEYKKEKQVSGLRFGTGMGDWCRDKALRYLPARLQGKLFRRIPKFVINHLESRSRYANIDFTQTFAVSDEMNYSTTIRLHTEGLSPKEIEQNIEQLRACLLGWEIDGEKVVSSIYHRDDLYVGAVCHRSPELIVELAMPKGATYTLLPSNRAKKGQTWRYLAPEEWQGGKGLGMNGSHRQYGVLILAGKDMVSGTVDARMEDIVPTLLFAMGNAVPSYMDGRVLREIMHVQRDIVYEDGVLQSKSTTNASMNSAETDAIRRRLEGLGYL